MARGRKKEGDLVGEVKDRYGVDAVQLVASMLASDQTSDRIKADLLKELINYRYSKRKALSVDLDTGGNVVFELNLGSAK